MDGADRANLPSAGEIAAFCSAWSVVEFALFGSVLRDDFGPGSDVDVCVVLDPGREYTVEDHVRMRDELGDLFGGRRVDLVERRNIRNPFMRHEIITTRRVIYAA